MPLPNSDNLETLDYTQLGKPFVEVSAKSSIDLNTMDFAFLGKPFVRNPGTAAPVTTPVGVSKNLKYCVKTTHPIDAINQTNDTGGVGSGFGEWNGVRYKGQTFTPTTSLLTQIAFKLNSVGSKGIKVYIYAADGDGDPTGSELYSFVIANGDLATSKKAYSLPTPLAVTPNNSYIFYLAPWDTGTDSYSDDYRDLDCSVANPYAGGKAKVWEAWNGFWGTPDSGNLDLVFAVYGKESGFSKSLRYEVLAVTTTSVQKSLQYGIVKPISVTKSLKYTVKKTITAITKTSKYTVVKPATAKTKTLKYTIDRAATAVTKTLKYTVTKTIAAVTKTLKYTIDRAATAKVKTLKYTVVKPQTAVSKTSKYTIVKPQTAVSKTSKYTIVKPAVAKTKSLQYVIILATQVNVTKSLKYAVKTIPAAKTKSLVYRVSKGISLQRAVKYTVKKAYNLSKSLVYRINKPLSVTKTLKYTTKTTPAAATKTLAYRIRKSIAITKTLKYLVKVSTTLTQTLRYFIVKNQSVTKSTKYAVIKNSSFTKSLRYTIKETYTWIISLRYAIRKSIRLTKTLQYTVVAPHTLTKSLTYRISLPPKHSKNRAYLMTNRDKSVLPTTNEKNTLESSKNPRNILQLNRKGTPLTTGENKTIL